MRMRPPGSPVSGGKAVQAPVLVGVALEETL
jgi:hypothetical protein